MVRGYEVVVQLLTARLGGGFVAYAPALRGCLADGRTSEQALENLADAVDCWLEYARLSGRRIPLAATVERVEVHADFTE